MEEKSQSVRKDGRKQWRGMGENIPFQLLNMLPSPEFYSIFL